MDEKIEKWIVKSDTEALLIYKEGRILYETYSPESDRGRSINGMSMVKNIIAILIGIAIDEGRILSKHDDVRLYLPEVNLKDGETLSIRDLLNHKSGIKENPFSIYSTLKGQTLEEGIAHLPHKGEGGEGWGRKRGGREAVKLVQDFIKEL